VIYTHAAVALIAAAAASFGAWQVQSWRYGAREAERLEAQREATRFNTKAADTASASHEADRVEIRTEFVTITQEVERVVEKPVYRNVCIDADGLRQLERAIGGPARAASEPAPAVPRSDAPR
jgi:hypothetical protein